MKLAFSLLLVLVFLLVITFGGLYFSNRYKSAFEADQKCHSEKFLSYSENTKIDCDHDLETRQWILFEEGLNGQPAEVLRRFKY